VAQVRGEERHLVGADDEHAVGEAIACTAASICERDALRAVSSTLAWSAASAVSNGLWSSVNSGAASGPTSWRRRYSSRAEACSSG
jgi:hypothetical protein